MQTSAPQWPNTLQPSPTGQQAHMMLSEIGEIDQAPGELGRMPSVASPNLLHKALSS